MADEADDPYQMADGSISTDPADMILGQQQTAKATAFSQLDASPDEAVRAKELGDATGVHPALVMNDLENFDKQNKAAMTAKLLNDNTYLQRYVTEDPLAAAISNDDYAQLDETTQRVLDFSKHTSAPKEFARALVPSILPGIASIYAGAAGAVVGAAGGTLVDPGWGTFGGGVASGGAAAYFASKYTGEAQEWLLSKLPEGALQSIGLDPESRALGAKAYPRASFLGGLAPYAATMNPLAAAKAGERAVGAAIGGGFQAGQEALGPEPVDWEHVAIATVMGATFVHPNFAGNPVVNTGVRAGESFVAKVGAYRRSGEEPPAGIDPNIDAVKLQENEAGVESLDQALATVQTSTTRERSPNTMADYLRMHTQSSIGIEPDLIKALYGENAPHPDDGLLGWVPNLENQLILADLSGADVRIPVADWLAKVDPGVAKTLRDGIRIRPEGMTKLEGDKPMPEQSDLPPNDVFDLVRESAGLKPLAEQPAKSLTLVEAPQTDYSGSVVLKHGRSDKLQGGPLTKFDEKYQGDNRYDANGGTFGPEGVYLDADGKWTNNTMNGLPLPDTYDVQTNFKKAFILTPETAKQLGGTTEKPLIGPEIVKLLKEKGYDGIIVKGFDKRYADLDTKARSRGKLKEGDSDTYTLPPAEYGDVAKLRDAEMQQLVAEGKDWNAERIGGELDSTDFLNYDPATLGLHKDVVQDQVFAFYPQEHTVLGKGERLKEPVVLGAPRRSLSMVEVEPEPRYEGSATLDKALGVADYRDFQLHDTEGKPVGMLQIASADGGKTLLIENIHAEEINSFGPSTVRDLLRQLKERFPNVEKIEGFRVSGARDKAGTTGVASLDLTKPPNIEDFEMVADNMNRKDYDKVIPETGVIGGKELQAGDHTVKPEYSFPVKDIIENFDPAKLRDVPKALATFFGDKLKNIVGDVDVSIVSDKDIDAILGAGESALPSGTPALYLPKQNRIFISNSSVRKGANVDHLREIVFEEAAHAFTAKALEENEGIHKDVTDLMGEMKAHLAEFEPTMAKEFDYYLSNPYEFIAAGWSHPRMQETMSTIPISEELAARLGLKQPGFIGRTLGQRAVSMWDAVKELVKQLLQKAIGIRPDDTILDGIFNVSRRIEEHKGVREELDAAALGSEQKPPIDEAAAIGMTKPQYAKYQELIAKQQADAIKARLGKAHDQQERRLSKEWKDHEAEERPAAVEAVNARPDVMADNFIRFKEFAGKPVDGPTKMATGSVPEEIRKGLPRDYFHKDGLSPDDYAALFGYPDGKAMLAHLTEWNAKVKASGLRPYEYKRLMINQEIERRMEEKYGNFDKEVMQAAQDQVTSETQLNILHEETIGLAAKAGEQFPLTKQALADAAKENFQNLNVDGLTVNRFLQAAGKSGRDAELALLAGDAATAFRAKQKQYFSMIYAKEAKALEKAQADLAKTTKKLASREVKGTDQEYTNFIHQLMVGAGLKVKRSVQDIGYEISQGTHQTLPEFVEAKHGDGWDLDVSPELFNSQPKPVEQMTVAEFTEFKDAIDSLAYVGREVNKIEIAGEKAEFDDFVREVVGKIEELPVRLPPERQGLISKLASRLWSWDAVLTRPEEMIKDLEGHEELGPLYRATIMGMMEGKHKRYQLEEELTKKMEKITTGNPEWMKTLDDTIPQDFFTDPYYNHEVLFDLDRKGMLNIMMNWGNKSNKAKFTRGYTKNKAESKALEANLQGLFDVHATKEDWAYVESMWDIFKGWKKETGTLYRNMSGIEPKWLPEEKVQTPHGQFDGGYFPVIYDRLRSNIAEIEEKSSGKELFSKDFRRATTGNRYTKERTGYAAPIEFQRTLEQVVSRMMQQIHDIAYRAPVMQNAKIFGDKRIMSAIRKHYGPEYADQLMPWVKRVANNGNMDEKALGIANNLLRGARMNLTINALGLNSRVFLSPDMGLYNPVTSAKMAASAVKSLMQGEASPEVKLAWEHSKEIPHTYRNMDRDFREAIEQLEKKNQWSGFKVRAMKFAFLPAVKVSQAFRINTFVDEFKSGLARGLNTADASAVADAAVRLRHGATGVTDLPAIMAGPEAMKTATIFYGYFSAMQQWSRQIPGNLRRGWAGQEGEYTKALAALYGSILIPAAFSALLFNKSNKDDSWYKQAAKAVAYQPLQAVPFLREAVTRLVEGYEPKTPWGTVFSAVEDGFGDAIEAASGKEPKRFIKTTANAVGLGLGLPMGQLGRTAQFAYDVSKHRARPKNILDWVNGIINGQIEQKKG